MQSSQGIPFNLAAAMDPSSPQNEENNFGGDISSIIIDPNAIDGEEEEDDPVLGEPGAVDVMVNNDKTLAGQTAGKDSTQISHQWPK